MFFKKKSPSKAQKTDNSNAKRKENLQSFATEAKNNGAIHKISDREIALSYMLW